VTAPSFIASSSADWVFGVARLISSARTMLAKIGPVGRQRVARELDPAKLERKAAAESSGERRLADSRNVLDQDVAAGQERRQREVHPARLSPVDQPHVLAQPRQTRRHFRVHGNPFMATNSLSRRSGLPGSSCAKLHTKPESLWIQ